jgi:diguanylate cyclase (GGDEF)-like protein/putative nucleotidyltransferase with HDIG domain
MSVDSAWRRGLDPGTEDAIAQAVARCERLPIMDRTVQRILALTEDEESDTSELVEALEADPTLAANMLRLANSAWAGRPVKAKTLRQALALVGRRATRQLCLEAVTFRFFELAPGNGRTSRGQLHIHAVAVATVASAAAREAGIPPELPHLAGLLHDCGKLVLPMAFGEEVMDEIASEHASGPLRAVAEWERLGADHAYAGAVLAEHSGLPDALVEAIAWHHGGRQGCATPTPEIACVQLANAVVGMLNGDAPDPMLIDQTLADLGLGPESLDVLAAALLGDAAPERTLGSQVSEPSGDGTTDGLTGLPTRRSWMARVQADLRAGRKGSVLVCDLDRLGALNDTYGRPTGDLVLTEIAMILGHHGQTGRLGEDGFAVWLPDQTSPASYAEFIVDEVAGAFLDSTGLHVSISVGAAIAGHDLASTLERAHQALGAAKAAGGGRACYGHRLAA